MGGLGNQLFQIFTVMAHAMKNGMEFTFQNCNELTIGHKRKTYWSNLLKELGPFLVSRALITGQPDREIGYAFKPLPFFYKDTVLTGYFQSLKYFQEELSIITEMLNIQKQIDNIKASFPDIFKLPIVSMHFRIGDYKEIQECHPVMPYAYYQQALRKCKIKRVLYFNERKDKQECEQIISWLQLDFPDVTFEPAPEYVEDWEQMLLMSCCDSNIIANSTFSWWGAVLGASKEVFYPVNWFGPKLSDSHTIQDLVLPNWKGI